MKNVSEVSFLEVISLAKISGITDGAPIALGLNYDDGLELYPLSFISGNYMLPTLSLFLLLTPAAADGALGKPFLNNFKLY